MLIKLTSLLTGKTSTREINVTNLQMLAWKKGANIQDAMPNVSADDREFIVSGITPEEWDEAFGE